MTTESPYEVKKLGSRVKNYDETTWHRHAEGIATRGVFEKFRQNPLLSDRLLQLGKPIYEASPDQVWGTGIHIKNHNSLNKANWYGEGIMYKVYNRVIEKLKEMDSHNEVDI